MVYQVKVIGLDALQLVLVGTALEASAFIFEIPTGIVADLWGRKLSVVLGYALIGAGFILWGAVPVFAAVLFAQVLWGLGYTFTSGALQAWLSDEIGSTRATPLFARGAQVAQVAGIVAIGISLTAGLVSLRLPLLVAGSSFVVMAALLVPLMPERNFHRQPVHGGPRNRVAASVRAAAVLVRKRPGLLLLLAVSFFLGFHSEGIDRLWTAHLIRGFHVVEDSAVSAAVWFTAMALVFRIAGFAATGVAHRLALLRNKRSIVAVMAWVTAVRVGSLLVFAMTPRFWPALAAFVVAWAIGAALEPLYEGLVNSEITDSSVRATVFSVAGQANALGQISVGPGIGAVGRFGSLRAALAVSAALLTPAVPLLRALQRRRLCEDR
jgi:DHA3 family tetracycline resistance protein-like MFS transporter